MYSRLSSSGLVGGGVCRVWARRLAGGASDPFSFGLLSVWSIRKVGFREAWLFSEGLAVRVSLVHSSTFARCSAKFDDRRLLALFCTSRM